jgi:uncharacterized protein YegL
VRNFAARFISAVDFSLDAVQVAVISFSTARSVLVDFSFASANDATAVAEVVLNAPYLNSGTRIGAALFDAADMLDEDAGRRSNTRSIVILVSDGESSEGTSFFDAGVASVMEAADEVYAIGVGLGVSQATLELVASGPGNTNVFQVDDPEELFSEAVVLQIVEETVCDISTSTTLSPDLGFAGPACAADVNVDLVIALDSSSRYG